MRIIKSKKAYNQVLEKERGYCVCVCIEDECQIELFLGVLISNGYGDASFLI